MSENEVFTSALSQEKFGFVTEIDADTIPKGLNEDVIRLISERKEEPEWMLDFRLKAFARWKKMTEPVWADLDYQN